MFTKKHLLGGVAALALVVAAACSNGGSGNPGVPYPIASNVGGGALNNTTPTAIAVPASTGFGVGAVSLTGTGSVSVSQSTTAPTTGGVQPLSAKSLHSAVRTSAADPNTAIDYITLTAGSATSITTVNALSVAPTGTIPSGPYYEAFWNGTQWVTFGKAGTLSGGVISFGAATPYAPLTANSGGNIYIAVYAGIVVSTPTPPPAPPVAAPSTQTVSLGTTGTVTVTSGIGIAITAASSNTGVATITPASGNTNTGNTVTFTITPVAVGTTTLTFTDQLNQKTTATVTVNNVYPSPNPNSPSGLFSLGDSTTVQVTTKSGATINAVSSGPAATVSPASGVADSTGHVTFTITGANPGTATITFSDQFNDTGTYAATVSNIKNGAFTNGLTSWTACSYAHTALTGPVNESSPKPVASPVPTQSPGANTTPIPSNLLTPLATTTSVPANDNPSPPPGVGATAPPVLGSTVALLGSVDDSKAAIQKGEQGICQQVAVSANTPSLVFWGWMGGQNYNFKTSDQNVVVLDSTGATVKQTLLAEQHCYLHPPAQAPGLASQSGTSTNGCWPLAYGGDNTKSGGVNTPFNDWIGGGYWTQFGPFDLSAYAGQTVTLYFGNYSYYQNTTNVYANFWYLGDVTMLPPGTNSSVTPLVSTKRASVNVTLTHH